MSIADKLREQRKLSISIDHITFYATRATVEECLVYGEEKTSDTNVCRRHITGWDGVTSNDILADGSDDVVIYDKALFDEVIADRPDWWITISKAIIDESYKRINQRATRKKK
jgi:hypothetical protein